MSASPADLLAWIAAAGSRPWFPSVHGVTREAIETPLATLWQAGLIEASDWVKGQGQGFGLTVEGQQVAKEPVLLAKVLAGLSLEKLKPAEAAPVKPAIGVTTFDRGEAARRALYTPPPLYVMPLFVILNVAMFLVGFFLATKSGPGRMAYLKGEDGLNLLNLGGLTAETLLRGDGWRLAASPFIHAGIVHLLINMYTLVVIGSYAEDFWGRWRFVVIYIGSALAASCAGIGLRPDAMLVGASGATCGLTAAVAVWMFLHRQHFDGEIPRRFLRQMLLIVGLSAVITIVVPRVSWEGHIAGALSGALLAFALHYIRPQARKKSLLATAVTLIILLAPLPLLVLTMTRSPVWQPILQREAARQHILFMTHESATLQPIQPATVQSLLDRANKDLSKSLQSPKLAEQARKLSEDAAIAAAAFRDATPIGVLSRKLPGKAERYALAVKTLADTLEQVLTGSSDDFAPVEAAKKQYEERWRELNASPWPMH